jgi:AcrR family transcriptional regulator
LYRDGVAVDEDAVQGSGRRSRIDVTDPRAVRTRQKLVDAFHAAVAESDPSAMSVAALARAAGINRTLFYSHFASPEELAIHALSDLFDVVGAIDIVLRAEHAVPAAEASRRALRDIAWFVYERRGSYARVLGAGAAPRLIEAVSEAFTERTAASLARVQPRPPGTDVTVTARFLAGGVLSVLGAWLSGEQPASPPDEVAEALVQCLPGWLNNDLPAEPAVPGRHTENQAHGERGERR